MLKKLTLLLAFTFEASLAIAGPAGGDQGQARWFRYLDDRGQPTVTDSVTPEHVLRGYDELMANMQLIRHVPAQKPLTAAEVAAAKAKHEKEVEQSREDKQIRRLYSSPQDAERIRDRQLDGLQARIDSSTNSLASVRKRRADEAQRAATFERTGKPVPADIKESIASLDRQAQTTQKEIDALKAGQQKVRAEFDPVIQRLVVLTGKPATATVATPTAAGAGAAPATAAPAKVPAKP